MYLSMSKSAQHPERFRDEFAEKVQALVEAKRKAGEVKQVAEIMGAEVVPSSADVIDLTELLRRSLKGGTAATPKAAPAKSTAQRSASAKKAANDERESSRCRKDRRQGADYDQA